MTWTLDPAHSSVTFSVKHMMVTTVRGSMNIKDFELDFDPDDLVSSSVRLSLDAASIDTGQEGRDAHLRSPDFLDVEQYPTIDFASTKINREDFGLTWNVALEQGGWLVGKDIKVEIDLEVVSAAEQVAAQAEAEEELTESDAERVTA